MSLFVFPEICSGCRNCEIWCSFIHRERNEFNPTYSRIKLVKESEGVFDIPMTDCTGQECPRNERREPICVEMCPTGAIIYTDLEDAYRKRMDLLEKSKVQPVFKLIAPWKYPFPWKEWHGKEV